MTYKITLPKKLRNELLKLRASIADALAEALTDDSRLDGLEREREKLQSEIGALEGGDSVSDRTASKLALKREKLRLVTKHIASSENPTGDFPNLKRALRLFRNPLHQAMRPIHDQIVDETVSALKSFFPNGNVPSATIADTPKIRVFANFMSVGWGLIDSPIPQGKRAIVIIDKLIKGVCPINFPK